MELADTLSNPISEAQASALAKQVVSSKALLNEVFQLVLTPSEKITNRASWVLSLAYEIDPEIMKGRDQKLLELLREEDNLYARTRQILRIYQTRRVPEACQGFVMDACYRFIKSISYPVAVKAFSITVIYEISKPYPELCAELQLVLTELLKHEKAPAIVSRGSHTLRKLEKLQNKKS